LTRIAVIDYGAGNLVSIAQALTSVRATVEMAIRPPDVSNADGLIVPGVGAAGPAMERLRSQGLVEPIREWIAAGRPFLGICLGLQLLFEASDEDAADTFGILAGRTLRLVDPPTLPHIGWNQVIRTRAHPLFDGIEPDADFYFVHSYAGAPTGVDMNAVLATTEHGGRFVSAIARDQLLGVQFHPERSGPDGIRLLGNFAALVEAHAKTLAVAV
jgi:imidazole glycerol-phosphate synthase subunit HisH